jgi:dTDP-glucose 4,6-dehydratase
MWLRVEDHCAAIWHLIEYFLNEELLSETRKLENRIYHVAGEQELENLEMAQIILNALSRPVDQIQFIEDRGIRPGHDRRYALDVSKLRALGWAPRYDLVSGIQETVEWYRDNAWWME